MHMYTVANGFATTKKSAVIVENRKKHGQPRTVLQLLQLISDYLFKGKH